MPDLRLGVLDQSPIPAGSTAAEALRCSVELAQLAERLGYQRYWVAEHHGSESFAGCSPEILVGHIASATSTIRVGSGGVMLMHYSPLKVAENFKLLACLHPGRIDLGIGRAPGSDAITVAALAYGSQIGVDYLPAKIADLKAWIHDETPLTEALAKVNPAPQISEPPEIWMLGSTTDGAQVAAHFGLPFTFAHFISPHLAEQSCALYRQRFQPSEQMPEPRVSLGVFVLCADSSEEAQALARCRDLWIVRVGRGDFAPFPSIAEAQDYAYTASDLARIESRRENQIVGTKDQVAEQLHALADRYGAGELSVVAITHEFEHRKRCYELLAEALL